MDSRLKQRLIGAAVLIALAVIFLPMLVQGPAPDSGVSDLSLDMPDAPRGGYETRDLPLVTPGAVGNEGLLSDQSAALPTVDTATAGRPGGALPERADGDADAGAADAGDGGRLPASVAAGDYAIAFGAYATAANAETVVNRLRLSSLPAYSEQARVGTRDAWRVRIGPYASRADAERARIAAARVGQGIDARVIALDAIADDGVATTAAPRAPSTPAATAPPAAATVVEPLPPSRPAAPTSTVAATPPPAPAPAATPTPEPTPAAPTAAAGTGFAVQLGAFSSAADATALRDRLRAGGINAFTEVVQTDRGTLTRVKAGPVLGRPEAEQLKAKVNAQFGVDGLVRSHP